LLKEIGLETNNPAIRQQVIEGNDQVEGINFYKTFAKFKIQRCNLKIIGNRNRWIRDKAEEVYKQITGDNESQEHDKKVAIEMVDVKDHSRKRSSGSERAVEVVQEGSQVEEDRDSDQQSKSASKGSQETTPQRKSSSVSQTSATLFAYSRKKSEADNDTAVNETGEKLGLG